MLPRTWAMTPRPWRPIVRDCCRSSRYPRSRPGSTRCTAVEVVDLDAAAGTRRAGHRRCLHHRVHRVACASSWWPTACPYCSPAATAGALARRMPAGAGSQPACSRRTVRRARRRAGDDSPPGWARRSRSDISKWATEVRDAFVAARPGAAAYFVAKCARPLAGRSRGSRAPPSRAAGRPPGGRRRMVHVRRPRRASFRIGVTAISEARVAAWRR